MQKRVLSVVLLFLFLFNTGSYGSGFIAAIDSVAVKGIRIKGNVIDEFGYVVEGAKVYVKGNTKNYTYTDEQGDFQLIVKDEDVVLVFEHEGLKRKLVKVGKERRINVELQIDRKM